MGLFLRQFGEEELKINEEDKKTVFDQLRKIDEKRLELFAYMALIVIIIIISLDFTYFNDELRFFYLAIDSSLWIVSFLLVIIFNIAKKNPSHHWQLAKKIMFNFFPAFTLLWGTAVCAIDPSSILNLIAFYFFLFLYTFAVITPIKTLLLYYLFIFAEFVTISFALEHDILTENALAMVFVCIVVIPFYNLFRTTRVNSQSALLLLNSAKKGLEKEIDHRTRELQLLNSNLKEEINQRKIIESKLLESIKIAESNNRLKSEFLANISHEIRTPLNAIVGFTEMMTEDSIVGDRKKEFQSLVEKNTGYLLSIFDDIFDASLIKTEQINPAIKPFSVKNFIQIISYDIKSLETKHNNPHIELTIRPFENENIQLVSDDYYLKKAILRLIDNALKFTEKGYVTFEANMVDGCLEFSISDTGIGIPEKDLIKIFEPFVQGDGSFTRNHGGAGIGLTIVKGITQALGASLDLETRLGAGTRFSIKFEPYAVKDTGIQ